MPTEPSHHASPTSLGAIRYRIHFAKRGDMRWIGHRDLVRWMERLFRRIDLPLAMSQGFHPKPKIRFASALALGIEGLAEWVEVALTETPESQGLLRRLQAETVPGIDFHRVERVSGKMPQICRATYEIEPPESARDALPAAIERLLAATSLPVARPGRCDVVDVRPGIVSLQFDGTLMRYELAAGRQGAVRPRELLDLLGGADWESQGAVLRRVQLAFAPPSAPATRAAGATAAPQVTTPEASSDDAAERQRSAFDDRIHPNVLESLNENGP